MKKCILPLMISLLLLCGCADNTEESFLKFADGLAAADKLSFSADVRAEYADKTESFRLSYSRDEYEAVIEVIKPEMIAGIKARISSDSATLEYDGAVLDIGCLTDDGLTPISALPLMERALTDGHVEMTWTENGLLAARLIPSDDTAVTVWLSEELKPVSAEISCKEITSVYIDIYDWVTE